MEFQFGTNWAYYSHYVSDIFGALLALEGLMAFFLESTFVGIFFFGWDQLSRVGHLIHSWLIAAPVLGILGPILSAALSRRRGSMAALIFSGLGIAGIVATAGVSLVPFLLPSSTHPEASLTIWDSSSSARTLSIPLIAVLVLLPAVLIYTSIALLVMRGRVHLADVERRIDHY